MGTFIQGQILGMQWIREIMNRGLTALGLDTETRIGGSILFFGYDVVKIPILLCVLIFLVSCLQSFFPPARSRRIMGRHPSPCGRCSRICFWGSGSAP